MQGDGNGFEDISLWNLLCVCYDGEGSDAYDSRNVCVLQSNSSAGGTFTNLSSGMLRAMAGWVGGLIDVCHNRCKHNA